jgi:hypothetical protein
MRWTRTRSRRGASERIDLSAVDCRWMVSSGSGQELEKDALAWYIESCARSEKEVFEVHAPF